ncbi:MAG: hypothetical protein GX558_11515 [Clostridiales bacterium]|nr:hypothetical protein [Clostridiales bacterium]
MQGYDRGEAISFIVKRLDAAEFRPLQAQTEALARRAIELDFEYMRAAGVIDERGLMGDAYYDDDDAFEYIFDRMCRERGLREDDPAQEHLAAFVDQYMELQEQFMGQRGMVKWD